MDISEKLNPFALNCFRRITGFMVMGLLLVTKTPALAPPTKIIARDTPNDHGNSITVLWQLSIDDSLVKYYEIHRGIAGAESLALIKTVMAGERCYIDERVKDGSEYVYQVVAVSEQERAESEISVPAQSCGQWFNTNRSNVLIGVIVFSALILYFIAQSRKSKSLFIRRIAGLDAVEEVVGRATETGKSILYVPGLSSISDIATIASLNILSDS